ncbi:MAG: amidohydrolase [Candidatus Thermoplasmatota archaeon]|nr:amidohydrolase [Candidatus Thermoplasmatota archaeon]
MKAPLVLKNARFVLCMDGSGILEKVDVRLEDGLIDKVGAELFQRGDDVIDCSRSVVMPGLVNSHTHAAMTLLRGSNDDAPLQEWLRTMWDIEGRLRTEQEVMGAEMGFLEMVRTGTTACMDQYGAEPGVEAANKVGIRLAAGVPLISVWGKAEERLKNAVEFIHRYRGHDRIIPIVNLHSIYTNDEETMVRCGEMSKEEDVPLHVHCSETRKEVFENRRVKGRLGVEELDHNGCLWERTALVHMGWAASWELNIVREKGASLVHCPSSNQKLATGGFFPFKDLNGMGVRVGLGTDGAASNNSLDMFREMKEMALVQKGQYWDPLACTAADVLQVSTVNGNGILGQNGGVVAPGMNADLCVVDIGPGLGPLRKDNLKSALVYSAVGNMVRATIVGGDIVYNKGRLIDGSELADRYQDLSERLDMKSY